MDKKVCLDSDVIIELLAGKEEIKDSIDAIDSDFCTTSANVFELWEGRRISENVFGVLESLEIFDFDKESAKIAAEVNRKLKKEGNPIELRDLFIGAICIKNNLSLLTLNKKHFERLKKFNLNLIS